jgi:putative PIN family toxin of toxin-antitoxin system
MGEHHTPPKVVLDNNLFVAAYWNPRSASARLIAAAREGRLLAAVSAAVRREIVGTLRQIPIPEDYRRGVEQLLRHAERVEPAESFPGTVPDDPEDEKYLECAVAAGADYVVSSDRHLLELGSFRGVEIVSPSALARELKL